MSDLLNEETPGAYTGDFLDAVRNKEQTGKLLAYAKKHYSEARRLRMPFERQWYMNMAFFFGKQWVQWNSVNASPVAGNVASDFARLVEPPAPAWRVRLVTNKIRPIIRKELAKITKERPQGFVIPLSSEDEDVYAARAAEQISEHLWREIKMNKVIRQAEFWALLCGVGFVKDYFDKNKTGSDGVQGKICAEKVTPFHLLICDPQEEELEGQPYVIHEIAKTPDWVEQKFGKKVEPDTNNSGSMLEQKFLTALGVETSSQKKYVAVKEMWIKPNKEYKNGGVLWYAQDTVLNFQEGWPYEHQEYPFTKLEHIPSGQFYATSVIEDLIPLQKEYNRSRSQIIESKNRMSKPQLVAARGSINPNKITSEPGLVIEYVPGFTPPQPLPLQNLPSYVLEELERIQRDMDDISSQHEVTKGRTPPGVSAATAISFLQEEDDSTLAPSISSLEEGVERIGKHFLSHVKQYWQAERTVLVLGDNNQWESYVFNNQSIRGNTQYQVQAGSMTPRSRAAKQAFLMELGKMGWITPDRALKYLDLAETGRLYEEMQVDIKQAQRENMVMASGAPLEEFDVEGFEPQVDPETGEPMMPTFFPTNSWDEHVAHIAEHNLFRKKEAFERLPDEIKMIFEQHVNEHIQQASVMMPMMGMMQGQNGQQPQMGGGETSSEFGTTTSEF